MGAGEVVAGNRCLHWARQFLLWRVCEQHTRHQWIVSMLESPRRGLGTLLSQHALVDLANLLGAHTAIGTAPGLALRVLLTLLGSNVTHDPLMFAASDVSLIAGAAPGGIVIFISLLRNVSSSRRPHTAFDFTVHAPSPPRSPHLFSAPQESCWCAS